MQYTKLKFPHPKMTLKFIQVQQKDHSNPDTMNKRPLSSNPSKANPKIVPNSQTTGGIYSITMSNTLSNGK